MLSFALATWLLFSPPEAMPATKTDLTAKIEAVLSTPEPAKIAELEQAIADIEAQPLDVLTDKLLPDELLRARVVLAWAYEDPQKAQDAMDEAIRSSAGRALPLSGLGTPLKTLAKDRTDALNAAGTATIEADCSVPCQMIVNERRTASLTDPLPLGSYRVWVVATKGDVEPLYRNVVLRDPGQNAWVEFGKTEVVVPPPDPDPAVDPKKKPKRPKKTKKGANLSGNRPLLPLWAEIVGVVAGVGLVATGAALLAIDGNCRDSSCEQLIENTAQGAALVGIGSGVLLSFGALLTVDRVRAVRGKEVTATLSWTLRF